MGRTLRKRYLSPITYPGVVDPAHVQRFALLLMAFGATLELSDAVRRTADPARELGYPLLWLALLLGIVGFAAAFDRAEDA